MTQISLALFNRIYNKNPQYININFKVTIKKNFNENIKYKDQDSKIIFFAEHHDTN